VIIEGDKIKVLSKNDESVGVFFENIDTGMVFPVTKRLTQNDQKNYLRATCKLNKTHPIAVAAFLNIR
jgi:hypothetical protein